MQFSTKNTLKNNHDHTPKKTLSLTINATATSPPNIAIAKDNIYR